MSHSNEIEELSLDQTKQEQAKKYAYAKRCLTFAEMALIGILLLILAFSGLSIKLREFLTFSTVPAATIYLVGLMVARGVLAAPLSYYSGFVLPRRYGLSIQKFGGWLGDEAKTWILGLAFGAGIVAAAYWFSPVSQQYGGC